jgi:hypothetical protein
LTDPEKYDFFEPRGWARGVALFPQRSFAQVQGVNLYGICPRCHDHMDVTVPIGKQLGSVDPVAETVAADALGETDHSPPETDHDQEATSRVDKPFEMTVLCNCHVGHPGRPDDVTEGCGAFGNLMVGP